MNTRKAQMPKLFRAGEFQPSSLNEEARTVDVIFTTGHRDLRRGFWSSDYYEELEVSDKAVRLGRLNNGAPFLDLHNGWSSRAVIGVVERAWIENGVGMATVRFSSSEYADELFRDVKDGIRRNVSVGYRTHRYKEEVREGEDIKTRTATDWEPYEISLVPMGFDPGAQVRSAADNPHEMFEVEIENARDGGLDGSDDAMSKKAGQSENRGTENQTSTAQAEPSMRAAAESDIDPKKIAEEATAAERKRVAEINKIVRSVGLEDKFADDLVARGVSLEDARALVIDAIAAKDEDSETRSNGRVQAGKQDEILTQRQGIENALLHRWDPSKNELKEPGREFRGLSLLETARACLEIAGVRTRGMTPYELTKRALHTSSDFANILANVANNTVRQAYAEAPQTFLPLVRTTTAPDFKPIQRSQLGDGPELEEVLEDGEYKRGTIGDAKEVYELLTYGKVFAVTRKAIINDQLDAFTRIPMMLGRRAAEKESDLFWAIFTGNPLMGDSKNLFSADHSNLDNTGAVISVASLGAGRQAMRNQTGLDGALLNIMARYLIVPAALETKAEQFLSQNLLADQAGSVNPFAGKLQPIVEPRLDAVSTTAWYMGADPAQIDVIERAYLAGNEGVFLDTEEGFDTDGVKWKVRLDVGYKAIDWRGLYKNVGAAEGGEE